MLFNSYTFIFLFLPFTLAVYFWLNHLRCSRAATAWLAIASLFYYACWNLTYLPLILGSILFNFGIGSALIYRHESPHDALVRLGFPASAQAILIFGITGNLALLGIFKYSEFVLHNINLITNLNLSPLNLSLPVGISFFTFTQIAYLVDVHRQHTSERSLLHYTVFVSYFPCLFSGPILRHKEFMPQFLDWQNRIINYRHCAMGVTLFIMGLSKKVLVADTFAIWADAGFADAAYLQFMETWFVILSFTLQLYFDFSGYTDMAIGAAMMFNIQLPINFNSPYKAPNIIEFWRRWHMTLTRWVKDYLFTPLGMALRNLGQLGLVISLTISMLVIGIWHGASMSFLAFGMIHAAYMVVSTFTLKSRNRFFGAHQWLGCLRKVWGPFITFNLVMVSLVFFRAKTFSEALSILQGMCGLHGFILPTALADKLAFLSAWGVRFSSPWLPTLQLSAIPADVVDALLLAAVLLGVALLPNSQQLLNRFKPTWLTAITIAVLFVLNMMHLSRLTEFVYFKF